jgi:hypothetical protein
VCALRAALAIGRFACVHAGATWTSRTTSAPWAARNGHTSVVDATGAIYVIGGGSYPTVYRDVWASTNGGADRTRAGSLGGTGWVGRGTKGVLRGTIGVLGGTPGPLQGYSGCTLGVSDRVLPCRRTLGVPLGELWGVLG